MSNLTVYCFHLLKSNDKLGQNNQTLIRKTTSVENMQILFTHYKSLNVTIRSFSFFCVCLSFLLLNASSAEAKCLQREQIAKQAKAKAAAAVAAGEGAKNAQQQSKEEAKDDQPQNIIDSAAQPAPPSMADDEIKLHMWDGSIVGGKVSVQSINVMTEFGQMTIPINQIVEFYPGLDSFPQKQARLKQLVRELGDGTYQVREDAHRSLVKMGLPLRKEILKFTDGGSVERKKHLIEIRKELDELLEDAEDMNAPPQITELARYDKVVTPNMTVVGKIQEELFEITSKFGELKVRLEDIEHASRDVKIPKDEIRRKLTLDSDNFYQRKPKSAGIRVNKGDRIRIKAGGVMDWTNWNTSSTPHGLTNQGNWRSINSGTLIACIGKDQNNVLKVGAEKEWVAKRNGVLYFAIAVQDNYVKGNSYRWAGSYEVKVVVTPVSK